MSKTNLRGLAVATAVVVAGGTVLATNASAAQVDTTARSVVPAQVRASDTAVAATHAVSGATLAQRAAATHRNVSSKTIAKRPHRNVSAKTLAKRHQGRVVSGATMAKRQAHLAKASRSAAPYRFGTVGYSKWYAKSLMSRKYGWGTAQFQCLDRMWIKESNWRTNADDSDNGYTWGIPQARPGTKMKAAGADWYSNPETQIRWGLGYIKTTYRSPCNAWSFWQNHHWY